MAAILFCSFLLLSLVSCSQAADEKSLNEYLDKFSHINVIEVLSNDRMFQAYYKCFMEEGPCTPEARDMRDVIPLLTKSACETCSEKQKKEMVKYLEYIKENRAKEWEDLLNKFDPKRETLDRFLASVPK